MQNLHPFALLLFQSCPRPMTEQLARIGGGEETTEMQTGDITRTGRKRWFDQPNLIPLQGKSTARLRRLSPNCRPAFF